MYGSVCTDNLEETKLSSLTKCYFHLINCYFSVISKVKYHLWKCTCIFPARKVILHFEEDALYLVEFAVSSNELLSLS